MNGFLFVIIALAATGLINAGFKLTGDGMQTRPAHSGYVREIISQWYWIRGYGSWMEKDERSLRDHYRFATAVNPRNLDYWRLAAQTLAYDCAAWKIESRKAKGAIENGIRAEYGKKALEFYETSRPWFENNPDWWLGAGFLAERTLQDRALALKYFQTALEKSDHAFLAGRMVARLLLEEKRYAEAYDFLKAWYPRLPDGRREARKPAVLQWIRNLETHLQVAKTERLPEL